MSLVPPTINTGPAPAPSSSSSSNKKLTKKQQKALAFRDRKSGKAPQKKDKTDNSNKKKSKADGIDYDLESEMDVNAIPAMENQDLAGEGGSGVEVEGVLDQEKGGLGKAKGSKAGKGKGKHTGDDGAEAVGSAGQSGGKAAKKRKRQEEEEGDVAMDVDEEEGRADGKEQKKKKQKKAAAKAGEDGEDGAQDASRKGGKQRFILFVGNFSYTTPKEAIQKHFAVCDPPPEVRLLTPKPRPGVAARPKSKGCAFLEFKTKAALQQALKLHQSMLDGRMINVELTAGGGGKSEARLNKVKERNKGLLNQRQKKVDIASKSKKPLESIPSRPDRPQRFSSTSGIDATPTNARTWSVGDQVELVHRGGKKHVRGKKKSSSSTPWGTGVNAIPVG